MKRFIFKVYIQGDGEDQDAAWENASLKDLMYDDAKEICPECNMEIDNCECPEDNGEFLGDKWLEKADEEYERSRDENIS